MAAPAVRQAGSSVVRSSSVAWLNTSKATSLAEKLDQRRNAELDSQAQAAARVEEAARQTTARQEVLKSFSFHIGADLPVPTVDKRKTHTVDAPAQSEASPATDPFAGLPLQAWAERLGERIMPAYELVKEEQKKAKLAAKQTQPREVQIPAVPHVLPFTRWASQSTEFRSTFIAEDRKTRKRARLSWYHPDDTMVPRDWFKGGLLADLKYYAPFARSSPAAEPVAET